MRSSPLQSNFSAGEFSPLLMGRVDVDRYKAAVETCLNFIPLAQGPLTRRPGTKFVAEVKDSADATRLVRFEFSTTQAYILEFGDLYIRFYKDNGQIESAPNTPYEVTTPYAAADLARLRFTQSADVLYIVHPNYEPRKLTRTGHTSWTLSTISFLDGPYLPENTTTLAISPSATTGSITLSATAAVFSSTDVGRLIRIRHGSTWGYATITGFTSSTSVSATVGSAFGGTGSTNSWRLGLFSAPDAWPSCIVFHEDRLVVAGGKNAPQRLDGSKSGDYENFAPTDTSGAIASSNSYGFSLNSNDVNAIKWLTSDEKGLLAGSLSAEWWVRPAATNEALSATNVSAKKSTSWGSATVAAVQMGRASMFIQRAGRKLREMAYFFDADGFRATDLTELSEHVTESGIVEMAFQQEPRPILWCVRNDGVLAAMTYDRDLDALKVGWHRHVLGGYGDAAANPPKVESAAVIPSSDGTTSELWLLVQRHINGTQKRYVEYLSNFFEQTDNPEDAYFLDCGLTYDDPKTITDITGNAPMVVTSASHGFADGDKVLITEVSGLQEVEDGVAAEDSYLNYKKFTVANKTTNTFELASTDGSALTGYISGGKARKLVSTISGLSHLQNETVGILVDGAAHADKTVSGGSITLDVPSAVVHVGKKYNSDVKLLRIEAGSADGTALGKKRKIGTLKLLLLNTLGIKIGTSFDKLKTVLFRTSQDRLGFAPALFTGVKVHQLEGNYDTESQICIRVEDPLPATILSVMPQMTTQDSG